jgi:acyl carrier protein
MKDQTEIKNEVSAYIKSTYLGDPSKIADNTLIFREGYFDSMGFVSLIAFLEEKFGISTNDEDLIEENFESINAIAQFLDKKLTVKA